MKKLTTTIRDIFQKDDDNPLGLFKDIAKERAIDAAENRTASIQMAHEALNALSPDDRAEIFNSFILRADMSYPAACQLQSTTSDVVWSMTV